MAFTQKVLATLCQNYTGTHMLKKVGEFWCIQRFGSVKDPALRMYVRMEQMCIHFSPPISETKRGGLKRVIYLRVIFPKIRF